MNLILTPKVSIIIPIYNVEKYLDTCLQSVSNQSLKEIEIICIDDFSKDSSFAILQAHAERDHRIIALRNEVNVGQGNTRNQGIEIAKGDYIGFIDSDDYIPENYFESLYSCACRENADIVGTKTLSVLQSGETKEAFWPRRKTYEKTVYTDANEKIGLVYTNCNTSPCSHIYRKNLIHSNPSLRFANKINGEDQYFNFVAFHLASKICFPKNSPPYYYRSEVGTNAVPKAFDNQYKKKLFDQIEISRLIFNYSNKNNLNTYAMRGLIADTININLQRQDLVPQEWKNEYYNAFKAFIDEHIPLKSAQELLSYIPAKTQKIRKFTKLSQRIRKLLINLFVLSINDKDKRKKIRQNLVKQIIN